MRRPSEYATSAKARALELGWIRDNVCALTDKDYLQMCLRKTSWYSFIYPMRVGALIATGRDIGASAFCSLGWYVGAAFQIQDDLLNLSGDYGAYGKEIGGDLLEGKRTLILIHSLKHCTPANAAFTAFLALTRNQRTSDDVALIFDRIQFYGSIDHVRRTPASCRSCAAGGRHNAKVP